MSTCGVWTRDSLAVDAARRIRSKKVCLACALRREALRRPTCDILRWLAVAPGEVFLGGLLLQAEYFFADSHGTETLFCFWLIPLES